MMRINTSVNWDDNSDTVSINNVYITSSVRTKMLGRRKKPRLKITQQFVRKKRMHAESISRFATMKKWSKQIKCVGLSVFSSDYIYRQFVAILSLKA